MDKEPAITINGNLLKEGQAITIRVALEHFATDLLREGLGNDEKGNSMTQAYLERIQEIRSMIFQPRLDERKPG